MHVSFGCNIRYEYTKDILTVRYRDEKEGIVKSKGDGFHVQKIKNIYLFQYNQPIKYIFDEKHMVL